MSRLSGEYPEPLDALLKRLECDPRNTKIHFSVAEILVAQGMHSEAIPHLQQARRDPFLFNRAMLLVATAMDALGLPDAAEAARQQIREWPDDEGPPDCAVPSPLSPLSPPSSSAAKKLPSNKDEEA